MTDEFTGSRSCVGSYRRQGTNIALYDIRRVATKATTAILTWPQECPCFRHGTASHAHTPPPTCTILISNDSSSSSHFLSREGETVWKREAWRENRDTRKKDRYPVLRGRESRPLEERLFDKKGCLWRTRSAPWGLTRCQSRGESTHLVLCAQLQKLISSALRLISI